MPVTHPPYPPEFRREAARLMQSSGKSRRAIARELRISNETLRLWVKQSDIDEPSGRRHVSGAQAAW
jgi:transposase